MKAKKILGINAAENFLKNQKLTENLTFLFFIAALAVVYIWNTHYAERNIREINKLDRELKKLRWEYMSMHSDLMYRSKQSEVAKEVRSIGLKELTTPPKKIIVRKDEH